MKQPKNALGQFQVVGDEPLAKKTLGVRLTQTTYDTLMNNHPDDYTTWVREVITQALKQEQENK